MEFELVYTTNHTIRLWLYPNNLVINPTCKIMLDALSVWGGSDKDNSWEFNISDYKTIHRMASRLWEEKEQ